MGKPEIYKAWSEKEEEEVREKEEATKKKDEVEGEEMSGGPRIKEGKRWWGRGVPRAKRSTKTKVGGKERTTENRRKSR